MDAIIFGGAVAMGAFGAGALSVLARSGLRVRRVVGTSSGAMNAAYCARAVRAGVLESAGDELARIWLDEGSLFDGVDVSLRGIFGLRGISDSKTLIAFLRRHITPSPARHRVEARLVTTNSAGEPGRLQPHRDGTTFEHVLRFDGATFDDQAGLESLFLGVAASAAFPGLFVPQPLTINGREAACFDGGVVNNTAVKYAIEGAPEVDRLFVIVPFPTVIAPTPTPRGLALVAHLVDILIQERLYRDLREAYEVNATLAKLEAEIPDPATRHTVLRAMGWSDRRRLDIVEIRPREPLRGGPFDGFLSRALRRDYIEHGASVAREWASGASGASGTRSRHVGTAPDRT